MVADMAKVLDWFVDVLLEKKWKVTRVILGPGKDIFVGMHPDVLRILLKSGK